MIDRKPFKDTELSRLGFGTMRLPVKNIIKREANPSIDYAEGQRLIDYAYEQGVNYFDTAYMYHAGKSEKFIGTALKKYPRESYYLVDKLPIWMCLKKSDMEKIFKNQLERTGADYFDNYLLHALDGGAFDKCEKYGAYDFLKKKQAEGRIKNIGFSFHGTIEDLERIVAAHEWDFAQIQLNYLDWTNQKAKEQYDILTNAGIPVIVMEPVRGGKLADVPKEAEAMFKAADPNASIASWAIRFCASLPNVQTILSGMNSMEQVQDNINALTDFKPLTDAEMRLCFNAAAIINKKNVIPCTGCDYCADCPKGIKISSIFAAYNDYKNGNITIDESYQRYLDIPSENNASSCVKCGKCATHCPQGIKIPDLLHGEIEDFFG
jgi:predicted aldo/keto reductase-like oxidoreductase